MHKWFILPVLIVTWVSGNLAVADAELEYWVSCVDEHSQAFGIRLDRRGALNCLVEELDNQRRNIDDLYSGPDTKEVMTDQAFRAAIKEWEIVRDRADAILNPKINRNLTVHTDKDGLNINSSQTAKPKLPAIKGYRTISR